MRRYRSCVAGEPRVPGDQSGALPVADAALYTSNLGVRPSCPRRRTASGETVLPSSSGLGHHPLKVKMPVQTRLGLPLHSAARDKGYFDAQWLSTCSQHRLLWVQFPPIPERVHALPDSLGMNPLHAPVVKWQRRPPETGEMVPVRVRPGAPLTMRENSQGGGGVCKTLGNANKSTGGSMPSSRTNQPTSGSSWCPTSVLPVHAVGNRPIGV